MKYKMFRFRSGVFAVFVLAMAGLFLFLLYDAQIIHGIDIDASTAANTIVTRETVEAGRGEITDRYGRVLVSNRTVYNAELDVGAMGDYAEQVATVRRLIALCRAQGQEWQSGGLPLEARGDGYAFTSETPFSYLDSDGVRQYTNFYELCGAGAGCHARHLWAHRRGGCAGGARRALRLLPA